ncbi:MAG TPA: ATP-binding protein, partial [Anaerolineales bacterium]|nr:ATP-binding protein [Anaerolineales bacterium]
LLIWGLLRYPIDNRIQSARVRVVADILLTVGPATLVTFVLGAGPNSESAPFIAVEGVLESLFRLLLLTAASVVFFGAPARNLPTSLVLLVLGLNLSSNGNYLLGQLVAGSGILSAEWFGRDDVPAPGSRRIRFTQVMQNLVPVMAVAGLAAYTIVEILLTQLLPGQYSRLGPYPAVFFSAMLIMRQGIRLGENQLQQYAQLVNSTDDAAFVCRENGQMIFANPAAYRLFRLSSDVHLGSYKLPDLFRPATAIEALEILAQAKKQNWHGEGSTTASGSRAAIALTIDALRDEAGVLKGLVGVARDVTSSKQLESELRSLNSQLVEARDRLLQMNAELEQKVAERTFTLAVANRRLKRQNAELQSLDRLKSEFVSLVSHELRAPLTNLNGGLELLLSRDDGLSSKARETIALMSREAGRLTRFVETILDLSAFEAGQLPIRLTPISAATLVPSVIEQFQGTIDTSRLNVDLPPTLPLALADERGLRSVLFQLLDNAFKYAPDSPVDVTACFDETTLTLCVADHGPGIPPDKRNKIFDMFHRLDSSDAQKVYGYGLGLHASRRFVDAMGGQISLEETPGGGATFCVTLRRVLDEDDSYR